MAPAWRALKSWLIRTSYGFAVTASDGAAGRSKFEIGVSFTFGSDVGTKPTGRNGSAMETIRGGAGVERGGGETVRVAESVNASVGSVSIDGPRDVGPGGQGGDVDCRRIGRADLPTSIDFQPRFAW